METNEAVTLTRDCEAVVVPIGTKVTLNKGEQASITQTLGGSYTVIVNGNMFRLDGKDADALGLEIARTSSPQTRPPAAPLTDEELRAQVWAEMKSCYDPEIPVNIVDLGLIYDCQIQPLPEAGGKRVDIKMTLTAPGCGMGEYLKQDVQNKILALDGITEANVDLVWEPRWNQEMMTEAAKLQLGLY